jgi:hypothetical protein
MSPFISTVPYGLVETTHESDAIASPAEDQGTVQLRPVLLRRRQTWAVDMITSGPPRKVSLICDLIDTKVDVGRGWEESPDEAATAMGFGTRRPTSRL